MAKLFDKLILPLAITLIAGIIMYWYQYDKPDIRYSLSEKLPISFSSQSYENIQLLEVKNVGKTEATGIVVKTNIPIASFDLQKNTKLDKIESSKEGEPLELKYYSLPPSASFKLILKTSGGWLSDYQLHISHSKGKASNAFNSNSSLLGLSFAILPTLFFGLMIFLGIKDFSTSRWESKITYNQDAVIRRVKKPLFLSSEKWDTIRQEAWERKLTSDISRYYKEPTESVSYKLLNTEMPSYYDELKWDKLVKVANDTIVTMVKLSANRFNLDSTLFALMKLDKPQYLNDANWTEIKKIISDNLSDILWNKEHQNINQLNEMYYEISKLEIDENYKNTYKNTLIKIMYNKLMQDITTSKSPNKYISNADISMLDDDRIKKLRDKAYVMQYDIVMNSFNLSIDKLTILQDDNYQVLNDKDKKYIKKLVYQHALSQQFPVASYSAAKQFINANRPEWIEEANYKSLSDIANDIISIEADKSAYLKKLSLLNKITNMIPLDDDKPDDIELSEWQSYKILETKLIKASKYNERAKTRINKIKAAYEQKYYKLKYKLTVLDNILTNPDSIHKVENIEELFSAGNLANLQLIISKLS